MSDVTNSGSHARRIRNALLASVFTLGLVGAAGTGVLITNSHIALADPVKVEQDGPRDFTEVVAKVMPAVVSVQVKTEVESVVDSGGLDNLPPGLEDFFRRFGIPRGFGDNQDNSPRPHRPRQGLSQGSGFFISEDGYIVTNAHVVRDGKAYSVTLSDGRELDAKVVGADDRTDLALLKVDGDNFTYVSFAQNEPQVGQWVLAIGNPFGLGGSVSAGIISAMQRDIGSGPYDNYLQIDAPVNRGNSGGPTFNTRGEVVGVATAIYSPSGGNVGIAFAIPSDIATRVVSDLKTHGAVTRGWLGVQIQPVTEDIAKSFGIDSTEGAIVADAIDAGPAKGAGIQAGDIIVSVNGNAVKDPKDLSERIAQMAPGKSVTVTVLRGDGKHDVNVTLGDLSQFDKMEKADAGSQEQNAPVQVGSLEDLGLTLEPNPDGDGVRVAAVEDGSPAAERGIEVGNVIVAVGANEVKSTADVEKGISEARDKGRDAVLLRVQGQNGTRFVGLPFDRG